VIAAVAVIVTPPLAPVTVIPLNAPDAPPIVRAPVLSTNTPPVPVEAFKLATVVSNAPPAPVPMPVPAASSRLAAVTFIAARLLSVIAPPAEILTKPAVVPAARLVRAALPVPPTATRTAAGLMLLLVVTIVAPLFIVNDSPPVSSWLARIVTVLVPELMSTLAANVTACRAFQLKAPTVVMSWFATTAPPTGISNVPARDIAPLSVTFPAVRPLPVVVIDRWLTGNPPAALKAPSVTVPPTDVPAVFDVSIVRFRPAAFPDTADVLKFTDAVLVMPEVLPCSVSMMTSAARMMFPPPLTTRFAASLADAASNEMLPSASLCPPCRRCLRWW
jgi:hypothetical protein